MLCHDGDSVDKRIATVEKMPDCVWCGEGSSTFIDIYFVRV